jgi:MOB kinase activator 1
MCSFILIVAVPFPKTFLQSIKVIYTRIFRVFAIVYSNHFSKLEEMGAVSHLNTSFKHFLYFVWEFDLLQNNELDALRDIVAEIRSRYEASIGRNHK